MSELEAYQHLCAVRIVALLKYGRHYKECKYLHCNLRTCTCGLSDVLGYGIDHAREAVG